ncbi:agarase [Psychrosphaera sp. F3M07]|uniref:agarase n=1 Tax=Psychrosphaera sp. F3M07 TaxID=2841560 RepID=UPI001C09D53E|nr:agarase [Psychrosphaera sp. F3M07]MBU2918825.1 agarase [Psychrosphaera sp. F3M07]
MNNKSTVVNGLVIIGLSSLLLLFGCTNNQMSVSSTKSDAFTTETELLSMLPQQTDILEKWLSNDSAKAKVNRDKEIYIDFYASQNMSTLTIKPDTPWKLSELPDHNLAFEVENISAFSTHFYLLLENNQGESQSRSISIPANYVGTLYFPLSGKEAETEAGFWGDLPPWKTQDQLMIWRSWRAEQVDVSTINNLTFLTIGLLEDTAIKVSDIRIRKNPPTDPNWMKNVLDKFGQNAQSKTQLHIDNSAQLLVRSHAELKELENASPDPLRSKFGGYNAGPQLKATGYFRTEKVNGKWWMVDPEGYVYFSHGPANVRMANLSTLTGVDFKNDNVRYRSPDELTPEDSMGIVNISDNVRESRYISSQLRKDLFEWLPEYSDKLAKHYSYRRSTLKGAVPHGETFNFYRANLERKYGDDFMESWYDVTLARMKNWGFTSFGNWVDPNFYGKKQVPYFANGWIIGDFQTLSGKVNHWGLMPDPYDPVFANRARATIEAIAKDINNSPWCAGIFIDNEKSWGEREGSVEARYGIILDALSKNASQSPAKAAFSKHLKAKYKNIDHLNQSWQTTIANWTALDKGVEFTQFSQAQIADLSKMLELLGEQYFIVVHNTLEEVLPNHLYMGARMANWGMPDEIIKASTTYSDVLSFNIYEDGMQDHYWKFLEDVDLPVVVGEFHIGTATDSGMFNPGIVHASDQKDRARKYKAYMQSLLTKPYMVGAHWFQYVDEPITGRALDGENANIGFVNVTDTPYPELIKAVKEVTGKMYQQRLAK